MARARVLLSATCDRRHEADAQCALGGDEGEARVVPVRERRAEPRRRALRQALEDAGREQLGPAVLDRREHVLRGSGSLEERPLVGRLGGSGALRERGDDARGVQRRRPRGSGRGRRRSGVSRHSSHPPERRKERAASGPTSRMPDVLPVAKVDQHGACRTRCSRWPSQVRARSCAPTSMRSPQTSRTSGSPRRCTRCWPRRHRSPRPRHASRQLGAVILQHTQRTEPAACSGGLAAAADACAST